MNQYINVYTGETVSDPRLINSHPAEIDGHMDGLAALDDEDYAEQSDTPRCICCMDNGCDLCDPIA
jgi:hypothetical protein